MRCRRRISARSRYGFPVPASFKSRRTRTTRRRKADPVYGAPDWRGGEWMLTLARAGDDLPKQLGVFAFWASRPSRERELAGRGSGDMGREAFAALGIVRAEQTPTLVQMPTSHQPLSQHPSCSGRRGLRTFTSPLLSRAGGGVGGRWT